MREELKSQNSFKRYYLDNFNLDIYKLNNNFYEKKLKSLKKEKSKEIYLYLLVTNYLQLLENFVILSLVLFHKEWIKNIFNSNWKVKKNFTELFKIKHNNWRDKLSFGTKQFTEKLIRGYIWDKNDYYLSFINESIEDYIKLKDILNSYKHWFRLNSFWKWTISIWNQSEQNTIWDYNNSIVYYTKKDNLIYENIYYFNWDYLVIKFEFVCNLSENIKLNFLNLWEQFKKETLYIKDKSIKSKYWTSIIKNLIFEIKDN